MAEPIVTPTLGHALPPDRDVVYAATFALAWREVQRLLGSDDVLVTPTALSRALGEAALGAADAVDPAEALALAGVGEEGVAAIRAGLARRFGDALVELLPGHAPEEALVAFAYLRAKVAFERPFQRSRTAGLLFRGARVQCFGHWGGSGAARYQRIATVHRFESPRDFVVELRGGGASVVVARREGSSDLGDVAREALEVADRGPGRWARLFGGAALQDEDELQVPVVALRADASFEELVGPPIVPGDRFLAAARQKLSLDVDERGARLVSEALVMGPKGRRSRGRLLICDGPFLLVLRRAGARAPYLAAWLASGGAFVPVEPPAAVVPPAAG